MGERASIWQALGDTPAQTPGVGQGTGGVTRRWVSIGALVIVMAGVLGASAQVGERRSTLTLIVHVDGFENAAGAAGIAVWDAARGFPDEIDHAVATTYATIQDGVAMARFDQLEPGTYAITVYHDRNDNRRFDKNWLGLPREAWGVSNNVRPRLRAPRFDEAKLELEADEQQVEIRVH